MAKKKSSAAEQEIVVFSILQRSKCAECGAELGKGALLRKERESALCLDCAELGHLVFLPRGDAALTRRSKKYSTLHAVVVRFSRARKRYERQGLLVQEQALEKAEAQCLEDANAREAARQRAALRRADLDHEFVLKFATHIRQMYPNCPQEEDVRISEHACRKYSGRVGRSASAKQFESGAIDLAVCAHVRHAHTDYDALLYSGIAREQARAEVAGQVRDVLGEWREQCDSLCS